MSDRPNILLITTDQQRYDTIAALGNQSMFTPHLNWLCFSGISYDRTYSDCPICMPARASIMTGRHGYKNGLVNNDPSILPMKEHATLPGILSKHGYQTRAIGKMHFEPLRAHYGFEHMELLPDYYRYMAKNPHFGKPKDHGVGENEMEPVISTVDDSHSLTNWTVERTIDFMETRDDTRPFFTWCSFAKPHPPFDPCKNYWDLYDGIDLPDPVMGDWSQDRDAMGQGWLQPTYAMSNFHRFSEQQKRATKRAYYACITQIDYNLGLLFARMRELELLENTWIIFTTDHGEMMGDHNLAAKSVFFEGSAHIPFIVRPPSADFAAKTVWDERCTQLTALVDIMPTCLDIAGVPTEGRPQTDGKNLLDLYRGEETRDELYGECSDYAFAMKGTVKLHFAKRGGDQLLFDIESDPWEQRNIIDDPAYADVLQHLRQRIVNELSASASPAVVDGQLVSIADPQNEKQAHENSWPGFHHRDVPTDVLH